MSLDLKTIPPSVSVPSVARAMHEHDVGCLPVVEHGRLVGVVTDRDLVVRVLAAGKDPQGTAVQEIMTPDCVSCSETSDVHEVALLMQRASVRRIPVVDAERRLVGIVSFDDLAKAGALSDAMTGAHRGL